MSEREREAKHPSTAPNLNPRPKTILKKPSINQVSHVEIKFKFKIQAPNSSSYFASHSAPSIDERENNMSETSELEGRDDRCRRTLRAGGPPGAGSALQTDRSRPGHKRDEHLHSLLCQRAKYAPPNYSWLRHLHTLVKRGTSVPPALEA